MPAKAKINPFAFRSNQPIAVLQSISPTMLQLIPEIMKSTLLSAAGLISLKLIFNPPYLTNKYHHFSG